MRPRAWLGRAALSSLVVCCACSKRDTTAGTAETGAQAEASSTVTHDSGSVNGTHAPSDGGVTNVLPVPTEKVAKMLNPDNLPTYSGPTGSVEGIVRVVGESAAVVTNDFSRCPDSAKTWGHSFREGPANSAGARPLADAVVVATGYRGFIPERREAKEAKIEACAYTSRTITMTYGQALDVKNVSKEFWTPMFDQGGSVVLRMATPNGDPVRLYPKEPGHYTLIDRDRKYVNVDVYAFLHPLHTATDIAGHYRIDGLPVGKLKISTMHRKIAATAEQELVVEAGIVKQVDLELKNEPKDAGVSVDAGRPRPIVH